MPISSVTSTFNTFHTLLKTILILEIIQQYFNTIFVLLFKFNVWVLFYDTEYLQTKSHFYCVVDFLSSHAELNLIYRALCNYTSIRTFVTEPHHFFISFILISLNSPLQNTDRAKTGGGG